VSWDLLVATHDRPMTEAVDDFLRAGGKYGWQGSLDDPSSNVLVRRSGSDGEQAAFTIDGPHVVEIEDLPDALAGGVLSPRFLVEISAPAAATAADRAVARGLAKQLAERFHGAVYDPQSDELLWPRTRKRVYTASRDEARIRVVNLSWYVEGGESAHELPAQLLHGLRGACPEALPRRYGDHEPFQHKMEPGRENDFISFWRDLAAHELRQMLSWKAQSPCFGGTASFPDKRAKYPDGRPAGIPGTKKCTVISLDFDGRALHGDERWCTAVVGLFSSMAKRLGAHYAAAHVERNVIAKRSLWYDGESERLPMPFSSFAGLPPVPTWLAWFGRPYAPHVADSMRDHAEQTGDGAWLFRGGPEPMDVDELANRFPSLPARLIFKPREDAPPGEPRVVAAEFIPAFDARGAREAG
jgi:hypothetical protein